MCSPASRMMIEQGLGPHKIGLGLQVHRGMWKSRDAGSPSELTEMTFLYVQAGTLPLGVNGREHAIEHEHPKAKLRQN